CLSEAAQNLWAYQIEEKNQVQNGQYNRWSLMKVEEDPRSIANQQKSGSQSQRPSPAIKPQQAYAGCGKKEAENEEKCWEVLSDDAKGHDSRKNQHVKFNARNACQ